MSRVFVLAHKRTVGSGRVLANELGAACIVPTFPPKKGFKKGDILINWGVGTLPRYLSSLQKNSITVINNFLPVNSAINKLKALDILSKKGVRCLNYTTNYSQCVPWMAGSGKVFARELLCSSQGKGIHVLDSENPSPSTPCKLYTRGFKKNREYRIHVVDGKVIHVAQKRSMSKQKLQERGIEKVNRDIRNSAGGYIYASNNKEEIADINRAASDSVKCLGLEFGAVDVLSRMSNGSLKDYRVCEVNTAPSLSAPSTKEAYVTALKKYLEKV